MLSTLIIGRMAEPRSSADVARLFEEFDKTDMPHRMGTRRRELFTYHDLYIHMQDFGQETGGQNILDARSDPLFIKISADLKAHLQAYDPPNWHSPADAMASRFYHWEA
jgi:cyclase